MLHKVIRILPYIYIYVQKIFLGTKSMWMDEQKTATIFNSLYIVLQH